MLDLGLDSLQLSNKVRFLYKSFYSFNRIIIICNILFKIIFIKDNLSYIN